MNEMKKDKEDPLPQNAVPVSKVDKGGSFDDGDPTTTNLYVGNIAPCVTGKKYIIMILNIYWLISFFFRLCVCVSVSVCILVSMHLRMNVRVYLNISTATPIFLVNVHTSYAPYVLK